MKKSININTNESLGSKLTKSMSFGESVFPVGYIQKTTKDDLFVKGKIRISLRKQI